MKLSTIKTTAKKLANQYEGVTGRKAPKVNKVEQQTLPADPVLAGLLAHFGKALGSRIYGCALIQQERMKPDELTGEAPSIDMAVRFTIGMLKRMRRQAVHVSLAWRGDRPVMTWGKFVDKLEEEQMEGERYGLPPTGMVREFSRIDGINKKGERKAKAQRNAIAVLLADEDKYNDTAAVAIEAGLWVESYMLALSTRKLGYLRKVCAKLATEGTLPKATMDNIKGSYAPHGLGAKPFLELIARYA